MSTLFRVASRASILLSKLNVKNKGLLRLAPEQALVVKLGV
jgi:hypothetical protein